MAVPTGLGVSVGWIPPASADHLPAGFDPSQFNAALMWTEYLNRLLGVIVGLLIFATVLSAWRHHRHTPRILWSTLAAFLLVGFQGWLGGVVVEEELAPSMVRVRPDRRPDHGFALYATVYAFFAEVPPIPRDVRRGLERGPRWGSCS